MPVGTPRWHLVIANTGVSSSPRVLGLRPVGPLYTGPSIPFGVQGRLIHLECLDNGPGLPIAVHDIHVVREVGVAPVNPNGGFFLAPASR